jgi:hypothetical protein
MLLKQFLLRLVSIWWAFLATLNLPTEGCLSGYHSAVCWQFPRYGYGLALYAFDTTWVMSGCIPGTEYHEETLGPVGWWCTPETP